MTTHSQPKKQERNRKLPAGFVRSQFKPGQSGNPKGRPRKGLVAAEAIRWAGAQLAPPRVASIISEAYGITRPVTILEAAVLRAWQRAMLKPDAALLRTLLEWGYGKPVQDIDLTSGGAPIIQVLPPAKPPAKRKAASQSDGE